MGGFLAYGLYLGCTNGYFLAAAALVVSWAGFFLGGSAGDSLPMPAGLSHRLWLRAHQAASCLPCGRAGRHPACCVGRARGLAGPLWCCCGASAPLSGVEMTPKTQLLILACLLPGAGAASA